MFEEEPYADDIFGDGMGGKKECPSNKMQYTRKVCLPKQCTYGPRQSDGYCPPRPKGKIYDDVFDGVIASSRAYYDATQNKTKTKTKKKPKRRKRIFTRKKKKSTRK